MFPFHNIKLVFLCLIKIVFKSTELNVLTGPETKFIHPTDFDEKVGIQCELNLEWYRPCFHLLA